MSENILVAFEILGLGWGGIFIVMIIIYLASLVLSRIFAPESE